MLFDEVKNGYTYNDMLLVTRYSNVRSRQDPDLYSVLAPGHLGFDVPIISANMNKITEGRMIQAMCDNGATAALHRFLDPDKVVEIVEKYSHEGQRRFGISIGVDASYYNSVFDKLSSRDQLVSFIVIDVAHGHHELVCKTIRDVKERFSEGFKPPIIAGNVSTPEAAEYLVECGADSIKVGIGPGSMCTTRQVTGFGYPQLSAVRSVVEAIRGRATVIADGGIRHTGDIVKALAAGADFVMLGGMLAGTKETPGNVLTIKEKKYKLFEGMASIDAQATFFKKEADEIIPEGEAALIPYKGSVYKLMHNIRGSIKAGFSYAGCRNMREIKEFGNNPDNWVKITHSGYVEGTPHGA